MRAMPWLHVILESRVRDVGNDRGKVGVEDGGCGEGLRERDTKRREEFIK